MFYNDICLDILFKRLDGERRLSRCLPNTSTFVPKDRSQCLCCVLPIMRCALGAHLDVGLVDRRTRPDSLEISRFLPSFLGKIPIFERERQHKCRYRTSSKLKNSVLEINHVTNVTTVPNKTAASGWGSSCYHTIAENDLLTTLS